LNAVEGVLHYPINNFELKEIRDGNSVINFWVEKKETGPGKIAFSGITAVGFKGTNQKILSVVFTVKNEGSAQIYIENAKLLLNDGEGSDALVSIFNTTLDIKKGLDNTQKESLEDFEMPEYFNPEIISEENIAGGMNVLIFSTQDKGSGISHYEIKEGFFDTFKIAESPYVLKNQNLNKKISIKAIDLNGNERLVEINAVYPDEQQVIFVKIILVLLAISTIVFIVKKIIWIRR
jgi:hypothetical protein